LFLPLALPRRSAVVCLTKDGASHQVKQRLKALIAAARG